MMYKRMDHTGSIRRIVFILLLWAISLPLAVVIAAAESLSFLDGQIRFYPAQREGDRILIPFAQPPADNEEVLLLYRRTDLLHLSRLQIETVMPKSMAHPRPHYVYGLTEGRLSDPQTQFLVAVGKGITSLLKWKSADVAMGGKQLARFSTGSMPSMSDNANTVLSLEDIKASSGLSSSNRDGAMNGKQLTLSPCIRPDKGFALTALQVLMSKELNAEIYYLQEEILRSPSNLTIDEVDNFGTSMKEVVGMVESEDSCHVLAYNTSDGYGLHNIGSLKPVGPIAGIIELSRGRAIERWLVLKSGMGSAWGYTFIDLPSRPSRPLNREPTRRFLLEDRG